MNIIMSQDDLVTTAGLFLTSLGMSIENKDISIKLVSGRKFPDHAIVTIEDKKPTVAVVQTTEEVVKPEPVDDNPPEVTKTASLF